MHSSKWAWNVPLLFLSPGKGGEKSWQKMPSCHFFQWYFLTAKSADFKIRTEKLQITRYNIKKGNASKINTMHFHSEINLYSSSEHFPFSLLPLEFFSFKIFITTTRVVSHFFKHQRLCSSLSWKLVSTTAKISLADTKNLLLSQLWANKSKITHSYPKWSLFIKESFLIIKLKD
jgi:hypothetical protein